MKALICLLKIHLYFFVVPGVWGRGGGGGRPLMSHVLVLRGRGLLRASGQGWADFLRKGQRVDIFSFVGLVGSVPQAQSCLCGSSSRRQNTNQWAWLNANKTLFAKAAWAWLALWAGFGLQSIAGDTCPLQSEGSFADFFWFSISKLAER